MSRNIGQTGCDQCPADESEIVFTEEPRPVTAEDIPARWLTEYAGLIVAYSYCAQCCTKYLAWVDWPTGSGDYWSLADRRTREPHTRFVDLSYRSTFNDEPGSVDLPKWVVERKVTFKRVRPFDRKACPYADDYDEDHRRHVMRKERFAAAAARAELTGRPEKVVDPTSGTQSLVMPRFLGVDTPASLEDLYHRYPRLGEGTWKLRVERIWPKSFRNVVVSGYLGDVHDSLTLDELKGRVGGGKYKITVLAPTDGGIASYRHVEKIQIAVPGEPAMLEDDTPVLMNGSPIRLDVPQQRALLDGTKVQKLVFDPTGRHRDVKVCPPAWDPTSVGSTTVAALPGRWLLLHPLVVTLEYYPGEVIAKWPEVELWGSGPDATTAIIAFKERLLRFCDDLINACDEGLGEVQRQWKASLRAVIEENVELF